MSTREYLPERRRSQTYTIRVRHPAGGRTTVHFTIGFYSDGRVGELWVDMHKFGSTLRDWVGKTAQMFSLLLQHQVPLKTVCGFFVGYASDPCGVVEGRGPCTSVMDAIAKVLLYEYCDGPPYAVDNGVGVEDVPSVAEVDGEVDGRRFGEDDAFTFV